MTRHLKENEQQKEAEVVRLRTSQLRSLYWGSSDFTSRSRSDRPRRAHSVG